MKTIHDYFSDLAPLNDQEAALLEQLVVRKILRRKQMLLSVGERCTFVGFIEEGVMRHFTVDALGNERTCDINAEGNWVTDARSFATGDTSHYTIEALKPCRVALLSQPALDRLYAASQTFGTISRMINERIVLRLGEISEMLLLHSPEERYKRLMDINRKVFEQAPRKDIAHLIGIQPESLSRLSKRIYRHSSAQKS